jgi:hypothetical protein
MIKQQENERQRNNGKSVKGRTEIVWILNENEEDTWPKNNI